MKRLAAHIGRRLARHAELQQDFAVERDLADKMPAVVGEEHRVVRGHMDAVRPRVLALTPRAQEVALAVEHHHRVVAAIEDIDIIVAVDPDPADLLERPAIGQLRPVGIDLISIFAASDDHRHIPSRDRLGGFLSRHQLRLGSRLAGVHRAAGDDLYDAGSKPDQDANLPGVIIGPGDIQNDAAAPGSERSTDLVLSSTAAPIRISRVDPCATFDAIGSETKMNGRGRPACLNMRERTLTRLAGS